MNSQEIIVLKLQPALKECEQHRLRLHATWEEAVTFANRCYSLCALSASGAPG